MPEVTWDLADETMSMAFRVRVFLGLTFGEKSSRSSSERGETFRFGVGIDYSDFNLSDKAAADAKARDSWSDRLVGWLVDWIGRWGLDLILRSNHNDGGNGPRSRNVASKPQIETHPLCPTRGRTDGTIGAAAKSSSHASPFCVPKGSAIAYLPFPSVIIELFDRHRNGVPFMQKTLRPNRKLWPSIRNEEFETFF